METIIAGLEAILLEYDLDRVPTYGDTEIDIARIGGRNDILRLVSNLLEQARSAA